MKQLHSFDVAVAPVALECSRLTRGDGASKGASAARGVVAEVLLSADELRDGGIAAVRANHQWGQETTRAALFGAHVDSADAVFWVTNDADHPRLGHEGRARFHRCELQAAVEPAAPKAVRGPPRTIGELRRVLVEEHPDPGKGRSKVPNLVAEAKEVEFVHAGWLDEMRRGHPAARQRRRIHEHNVAAGSCEVGGKGRA